MYVYKEITGEAPEFLENKIAKREAFEQRLIEIIKDPVIVIEGMAQSVLDTYEEEGIGYCVGFVIGELLQTYLGAKVSGVASIADYVGKIKVPKNVKVAGKLKNSSFINKIKNMKLPVGFKYKEAYGVQYAGIPGSNNGIKIPAGLEVKKLDDIISYIKSNKVSGVKNGTKGVSNPNKYSLSGEEHYESLKDLFGADNIKWETKGKKYDNAIFANDEKLVLHYWKHGKEFEAYSLDDYLNQAREVMNNGYEVNYPYKGEIRTGFLQYYRIVKKMVLNLHSLELIMKVL